MWKPPVRNGESPGSGVVQQPNPDSGPGDAILPDPGILSQFAARQFVSQGAYFSLATGNESK